MSGLCVKALLGLPLWTILATTSVSSAETILAGLAETSLPRHVPVPSWAAGSDSSGFVMDFQDKEVKKWRKSWNILKKEGSAHPKAIGWRVVPDAASLGGQPWCLRRLRLFSPTFRDLDLTGCEINAPGKDLLTWEYATENVFKDDASDGCALKDESTDLYYISVVCNREFAVDKIEVMQMVSKNSAPKLRVQQLNHGFWLDVGIPVNVPTGSAKTMFVAATCAPDICGTTHIQKPGNQAPKTCQHRACSMWDCCNLMDTCKKDTCTTPNWALRTNAEGTPCAGAKCEETFCCEERGRCMPADCTASKEVFKPFPPLLCKSTNCDATECCNIPKCDASFCTSGSTPKANVPTRCKESFCTVAECCDPYLSETGPPKCQQSTCTEGFIFKQSGFGKECAGPECTVQECCESLTQLWAAPAVMEAQSPVLAPLSVGSFSLVVAMVGGLCVLLAVLGRVLFFAHRHRAPEAEAIMDPSEE